MTPVMSTTDLPEPLGEILPLDVIKELRMILGAVRHQVSDRLWDTAAVSAVTLFEGYRRG